MTLDIKKIDERIQKLQEIRRIADDPEMVKLLLEFIGSEEGRTEPPPVRKADPPKGDTRVPEQPSDADIVNQVMRGMDGGQENGFWPKK